MTDTLALFPLSTVLLPGASLPLHVFEARYRQLVEDLVNGVLPDRRFAVIAIKQGWEVGEGNVEAMHDVGCTATLQQVRQLPEGRYDIVVTGDQRFRLLDVDREAAPYLMARVEWLPDIEPTAADRAGVSDEHRQRLCDSARAAYDRYQASGLRRTSRNPPDSDTDLADLAYALADDCMLSAEDRQTLLAETDPLARLRLVRKLLTREAQLLRALRAVPAPLAEFVQPTGTN